jgi:steroid 5-alpha reductase family enzyme
VTQNIILFLLGVPAKIAVTQPHSSLGVSDYVLGAFGFLTILTEFIADNQQYSYQTFKRSGKLNPSEWIGARIAWTKRDAERGFVMRGLWAWSRHPNFLCEQSFWVCRVTGKCRELTDNGRVARSSLT